VVKCYEAATYSGALHVAPGHYAMVYHIQSSTDSGECPILCIFYLVIVSRLYLLWQNGACIAREVDREGVSRPAGGPAHLPQ